MRNTGIPQGFIWTYRELCHMTNNQDAQGRKSWLHDYSETLAALNIGAKPNIYCEAIELVFGGSPKVCVLLERKALNRVKSKL